ncbi:NAD(P)H-quinone oxidoreductase subunit O, chloroplastic [Silene latifolia]|uniref:NAD(P)H-quinone oxidoreductase subunit O, chloroplastic n=1 Tax=Silene latifolia TaxID=37657 RepID=UPI003D77F879
MAFSTSLSNAHPFSRFSSLPQPTKFTSFRRQLSVKAVNASEPTEADSKQKQVTETQQIKDEPPPPPKRAAKPVYSMKKGQIVRVDKEKYLNSINYLSVGHPIYFKGLDYIYEDRGEVLDIRIFETGEYALVAWVGIPTSPAWLPTDMLIKSDKLDYERM